ncbi:MAG: (2Fe-2S) ferredoxin domain-containing protein [Planctomycetia bacterium]|nr:(2Fe-2S) ferredoxin domain-containing protein [Planctomycetia bacterium]
MEKLNSIDALKRYRKSLEAEKKAAWGEDTYFNLYDRLPGVGGLGSVQNLSGGKLRCSPLKTGWKWWIPAVRDCAQGAYVVTVEPMGVFYGRVTESDVHEIVFRTVLKGNH